MKSLKKHADTSNALAVAQPVPVWAEPQEPEAAEVNPFLTIHQFMKGRYLWAIVLAVLLGAALAYAGYKYPTPVYRSTGMIRFKPMTPRILYSNEHNEMMPMFDSFVDSQTILMRSQRVTDLAMQNDDWKALHRGITPEAAAEFVTSLEITHAMGGEIVQIAFTDKDPNAAIIGARSVLEAYEKLYGESDVGADAQRMQVLEDRRTALTNEIKSYNDRIQAIATEYGSDALEATYQYKMSQLNKIESELRDAQLMLTKSGQAAATTQPQAVAGTQPVADTQPTVTVGPTTIPATQPTAVTGGRPAATSQPGGALAAGSSTTQPAGTAATQPAAITEEQLAREDGVMRSYLDKRRDQELKIKLMLLPHSEGGMGMTAEHKDVKREQFVLQAINKDIAKYLADYVPPKPAQTTTGVARGGNGAPTEDLNAKVARLKAFYEEVRLETLDLGRKALQIKSLRADQEETQQRLAETKNRIEQLNVESVGSGRISVVSTGDRPGLPYKDTRKQFAAVGGAGGSLLGFGLIVLIAFLDRRLRSSNDAHGRRLHAMQMLGVLPRLPEKVTDVESAALAAHCVHGVRASLQVASNGSRMAYAITSPSAAEGKTSLTLALGMSFAASGSRTLMIDCDLIGGGLSSRVKGVAKTSLMTTLLAQRALTTHQLKAAMKEAQRSRRPLDEMLIETGALTREQIDAAIETQNGHEIGILDVVRGEPLLGSVRCVGERRLSVLTIGDATAEDIPRLSPRKLRRLIEQAKKHYDVILVDTGPVLGSLEAVMVGGQVDAVLMVMSRGVNRAIALRALDRVEAAGGNPMGIVFNRADMQDATVASSSSQASTTSRRSSSMVARSRPHTNGWHEKYDRMGPLVSAVAGSTTYEGSEDL